MDLPFLIDDESLSETQFTFHGTQLREPQDSEFQAWLGGIDEVSRSGLTCDAQTQIVLFAGDNNPLSPAHLGVNYEPLMQGLVDASVGITDTTTFVLADADGPTDTHIKLIHNGVVSSVVGLPDANGVLTTTIAEYDMADGAQLGGFLRWTLDNYTDSETQVSVSYYGHGTFLAPAVDIDALFSTEIGPHRATGSLFPLPYHVDAFPNFTDVHPKKSLITPYALQQMLAIGTRDGQQPIAVLDLTHCFALSIEEAYEVSNDGGTPYAEMLVGAANYAYFDPQMAGDVLTALDPAMDAATRATAIMNSYDAAIAEADLADGDPDVDHPRTLTVIDMVALNNTDSGPGVKPLLDQLSYYLLQEFDNDADATIAKLQQAASATPTYDTSYCEGDWELNERDALLDAGAFLPQLSDQFGFNSGVGWRAAQLRSALNNAVVARKTANGVPWYATTEPASWALDEPDALGISLFGEFYGQERPQISAQKRVLSWQARFYTNDTMAAHGIANPHPYRLISRDAGGSPTWSDVLIRYWDSYKQSHNLLVFTQGCLTDLPAVVRTGEVRAGEVTGPVEGALVVGHPTLIHATIVADTIVSNPLVQFNVTYNGQPVFTNTVAAGYMVTGTYSIASSLPFTPTNSGVYTFIVTVDPDQRFEEDNEDDNVSVYQDYAFAGTPFELESTIMGGLQWISEQTVPLSITSTQTLDTVIVQIYQYRAGADPTTQLPVLINELSQRDPDTNPYELSLPDVVKPGIVMLHIWGTSNGRMTQPAEIVHFNYVPSDSNISQGERVYYRFNAGVNENIALNLNLADGNIAMRVWEPFNEWTAQELVNGGTLPLPHTQAGEYFVELEGLTTEATYQLSSTRDSIANRAATGVVTWVSATRPDLIEPVMVAPAVTTAVGLSEIGASAEQTQVLTIVIIALLCLSGWAVRRKSMR
ncbi:MAG: hypothetical protein ACPG8W_12950 [Candidatus Promineifilaceae bacterium]